MTVFLVNLIGKNYALEIFKLTNQYDKNIFQFFSKENDESDKIEFKLKKVDDLRYGENPHQKASFYDMRMKKIMDSASW